MSREVNYARHGFLMCFGVIAVMILSVWVGSGRTASAHDDGAGAAASSEADDRAGGWLFPGEYESHQAMWMLWPTYENKAGFPSTEPMSDMIRAMSGHVNVNLAVQDADEEEAVRSLLSADEVPLDHGHFFHIEHLDVWARDMGPQFTRSRAGQLRINDWNFNYWGMKNPTASTARSRSQLTAPSAPH